MKKIFTEPKMEYIDCYLDVVLDSPNDCDNVAKDKFGDELC